MTSESANMKTLDSLERTSRDHETVESQVWKAPGVGAVIDQCQSGGLEYAWE